mmetsp:Transcript_5226/g.8191  ORF Transcript_5226/g.8191 Transcript_5226/m.8191 type:complete len:381 (+) Transcript_5226:117-1259(+)|eukprot:CAMPEP_0175096524 /NCGR_PEP_ID=MMETSP0086_2-20121207/4780_1 /TAXON_ID=136419 /ORGANISM="Unknown Unknown, Strain D1" /LENGTH=380 /DNA_ID=CAMNT_0016369935 /DNA_START=117 /DNA_END=1259 /DNA_ORIENTATION=+
MFGWGKKNKDENEHAKLRKRQIDEFVNHNPSAVLVDGPAGVVVYQLAVTTQFGQLKFNVYLVQTFPETAPNLVLLSKVAHPWVNHEMRVVGHPMLAHWTPHHSLGKIAREVYNEFAQNPPKPITTGIAISGAQTANAKPVGAHVVPQAHQQQPTGLTNLQRQHQQPPQQVANPPNPMLPPKPEKPKAPKCDRPELPTKFSVIESFQEEDLQNLLNSPETMQEMARNQESYLKLVNVQKDLYDSINNAARLNMSRRSTVEEENMEVQALLKQVQEQRAKLKELQQRQAIVCEKFSVDALLKCLDQAIEEADQASEDLMYTFRKQCNDDDDDDNDSDAEEEQQTKKKLTTGKFFTKYVKARQEVHVLQAKRERLCDLFGLQA